MASVASSHDPDVVILKSPRILLVDNDPGSLCLLTVCLQAAGYMVSSAASGSQALNEISAYRPNVIISTLQTDCVDGIDLLETVHTQDPLLPVIFMTESGSIAQAVDAMERGAFSFLEKPVDVKLLNQLVTKAVRLTGTDTLKRSEKQSLSWREHIVTRCQSMEHILNQLPRIAASEAGVFIYGESGTGKELFAQAIHRAGPRADKPMKIVNCSAIPDNLLESELFGHRKGAFTNAINNHQGLFRAANGGILFLDEIGDMSLTLQSKLLRVLQEKQVRSIGATDSEAIDVQVISATHRNLEASMAKGDFREDLFYRLNVIKVEIPPLRERREDISALVCSFLAEQSEKRGGRQKCFSPAAMELLISSDWPGNVRQLKNLVEQTSILATTPIISETLVRRAFGERRGDRLPTYSEAKVRFERDYLQSTLLAASGNVSRAARLADRNRTEFYRLLQKHQLNPEHFRAPRRSSQ